MEWDIVSLKRIAFVVGSVLGLFLLACAAWNALGSGPF
jgi:hypothetical protein